MARVATVYIRLAAHRPGVLQRAPLLERLLLHAEPPVDAADWRGEAFACIAAGVAMPAVAAAALCSARGRVPGQWVCVATPVHLVAGMSNVTLSEGGLLELEPPEAAALSAEFNSEFAGSGVRLWVGAAAVLLCVFDQTLQVATRDPQDVLGRDVFGCQPTGADAARLRRLMTEIEMWLFDHALNRSRTAQGRLPVTGLWLWGGGPMIESLPAVHGWTAGPDPLFAAWGDAQSSTRGRGTGPVAEEKRGAGAETAAVAGAGAGVWVCAAAPGTAAWPDQERQWLAPLSSALQAGTVDCLVLSIADRRVTVAKGRHWRFWRRPQPWWDTFERPVSLVDSNGRGTESNDGE